MQLKRNVDDILLDWKNSRSRKPILLRGARQVGKSTSVRFLGKTFDTFLEINFETEKEIHIFLKETSMLPLFVKNYRFTTIRPSRRVKHYYFLTRFSNVSLPLAPYAIFRSNLTTCTSSQQARC